MFHDTNIFEDDKPVVLWNFPWIRFAWCFLVIRLGLCLFGRNTTQGMLWPSQCLPSGGTWYWFVPLLGMLMLIARLGCSLPDSSMEKLRDVLLIVSLFLTWCGSFSGPQKELLAQWYHRLGGLQTTEIYLLQFCRLDVEIRVPASLGEGPLQGHRVLIVTSSGKRARELCVWGGGGGGVLCYKGTNNIQEGPTSWYHHIEG